MGLRGPGARPLSLYYNEPTPKEPDPRRLKLLQRLQTLANGTGLSVELVGHGKIMVSAAPTRIEALILREREHARNEK
jgi:hypothetical protein